MHECGSEVRDRFPDSVVEIGRAFADRPVKLGVNTFTGTTGLPSIAI
jgi:hypothetical protein